MAVAATLLGHSEDTTNTTSYTCSVSAPDNDSLLAVVVFQRASGDPTEASLSGGSLTYEKDLQEYAAGRRHTHYWAKVGTSPGAFTLTATTASLTGCAIAVIGFTGVDLTGTDALDAIVQSAWNNASGTTAELASPLSAFGAGNAVFASVGVADNSAITSEWGQLSDFGFNAPTSRLATQFQATEDTTPTATVASAGWSILAAEIKVSAGAPSPVTGTGSVTAAAATLSASAKLTFTGTSAVAAGAASVSASGKLSFSGTGAESAAAATLSASGKLVFTGTAAVTAASVALSGSGTIPADDGITGTGAVTAAAATLSATGKLTFAGTAAVSAPAASVSATSKLTFSGTSAVTSGAATVSASGKLGFTGTAAVTAGAETVSATAKLTFTGTGAVTAATVTLSASGTGGSVFEAVVTLLDAAASAITGVDDPAAQVTVTDEVATVVTLTDGVA